MMERSRVQSGRSRSTGYRNKKDRGVAFLPLTLYSHALIFRFIAAARRITGSGIVMCIINQATEA